MKVLILATGKTEEHNDRANCDSKLSVSLTEKHFIRYCLHFHFSSFMYLSFNVLPIVYRFDL